MFREELTENGLVVDKTGNKLKVVISDSGHCEECSAKIFCSPSENGKVLEIDYSGDIDKGEGVKIVISGNNLFSISMILYGLPLVILLAGILTGLQVYNSPTNSELYSFLTGLVLTSIYYVAVYFLSASKLFNRFTPKVVRNL